MSHSIQIANFKAFQKTDEITLAPITVGTVNLAGLAACADTPG
jgi:hypothetical protein